MKNFICCIILSLAITGCEPEISYQLQGHWHSIENAQPGVYQTLDINDTISILDQHTLSGMKYHPIPLKEGNEFILPTIFTFYSKEIDLMEDTLIIEKEFKYMRMVNCQHQEDLFSNLFINIELPDEEGDLEYESLQEYFHPAFISVGKLKDGIVYKVPSGEMVSSENYFIQINDILPGPEYIPAFVLTEYNASNDKSGLAIICNFDKNVPDSYLKDILEVINKTEIPMAVFKTVWDKENKKPVFKKI